MNQTKDLVSIIIPCFKQAQYLPDALDSVLAQTYPHWECVVVNDASPDDTSVMANEYVAKDKRFKLLELKANGGLSNARNEGIKATTGFYILPLDADDKLHPDYLEKVLEVFAKEPFRKVVYTDTQHFGINQDYAKRNDWDFEIFCTRNIFQPTAMYKRSDFLKTKGYRLKVGYEDWEFWMQLIDKPEDAKRLPEGLFYQRIKQDSMVTNIQRNNEIDRSLKRQIYVFHKKKFRKYAPEIAFHFERREKHKDWLYLLEYKIKLFVKRIKIL